MANAGVTSLLILATMFGSLAAVPAHAATRTPPPDWTADGDQENGQFGSSVATAGDVNGDGFADVIVGGPFYDHGQADEGRAFVYYGAASGLPATPSWTGEINMAGAAFGGAVASAGDVNGDGFDDVIVGAYHYTNGEGSEGAAFVFHGSPSGLPATPNWSAESNDPVALFGLVVAGAGDVNGDGFDDVIVGAPLYDGDLTDEGGAFVYEGSASGLSTTAAWTAEGDQVGVGFPPWFGAAVGTAGDVNGDGYDEVVVGAPFYDNPSSDEGRAFLYSGTASGLTTDPTWTADGDEASAYFGSSAGTAGDVDGNGYADVLVGAWAYDNPEADEGRVSVYGGSSGGLSRRPKWIVEGDDNFANFGSAAGTAGDIDGDGYDDLIVGANAYHRHERAYVYRGSDTGVRRQVRFLSTDQGYAYFGHSVGTAGDVNGDGFDDYIVGAYGYDALTFDEGRAVVWYGSARGAAGPG